MLFCLINDSLEDLTGMTSDERAELLASDGTPSTEEIENGEFGIELPAWTEANFASLCATLAL